MDVIDKLIQKYGAKKLITVIMQREKFVASIPKKKGRPKTNFEQLWGLKYAYSIFKSKYPHETQYSLADRLIMFVNQYRTWEKRPDLYEQELAKNKSLYSNVAWLSEDLDSKTVVNKIGELNAEQRAYAHRLVDDVFADADFSIYPIGWKDGDDLNDY